MCVCMRLLRCRARIRDGFGAVAVVLSGGYKDNEDTGERLVRGDVLPQHCKAAGTKPQPATRAVEGVARTPPAEHFALAFP